MRVLTLFNNFRGYENLLPVLKALSTEHQIDLVYTPYLKDPSWKKNEQFEFNLALQYGLDLLEFNESVLTQLLSKMDGLLEQADLLLLSDVQNFPGADLYRYAKKFNPNLKVIGFQHGLYQVWTRDKFYKTCDFYFAFGKGALNFFPSLRRRDLVFCGIPKLDKISLVLPAKERFILFIGQKHPGSEVIDPFLEKVEQFYQTAVVVRNHPQYPDHYKFKSKFELNNIPSDLWEQINQAKFVIATHSTCLIDALLLGKKVILLPNHGLVQLPDFKSVAKDFTVEEFDTAVAKAEHWDSRAWLESNITTTDFNATDIAVKSIMAIMGKPQLVYWPLYLKSKLSGLFYLLSWIERAVICGPLRRH